MPSASPFLDELITRWTDRSTAIRQDMSNDADKLREGLRGLEESWRAMRRLRAVESAQMQRETAQNETSWGERLRRLEEWKGRLSGLCSEQRRLEAIGETWRWFDQAQKAAPRLAGAANRRIAALRSRRDALRADLEAWIGGIEEDEPRLEDFRQRRQSKASPLLVSRARRRQETDRLAGHRAGEERLGDRLLELRRSMGRWIGRLYRVASRLESRAAIHEPLFEIRQRQIRQEFQEVQEKLFGLREQTMADALLFESGRRRRRGLEEIIRSMRCVEDVYGRPEPFWRRWWRELIY